MAFLRRSLASGLIVPPSSHATCGACAGIWEIRYAPIGRGKHQVPNLDIVENDSSDWMVRELFNCSNNGSPAWLRLSRS